jgi:hypothetical protein
MPLTCGSAVVTWKQKFKRIGLALLVLVGICLLMLRVCSV